MAAIATLAPAVSPYATAPTFGDLEEMSIEARTDALRKFMLGVNTLVQQRKKELPTEAWDKEMEPILKKLTAGESVSAIDTVDNLFRFLFKEVPGYTALLLRKRKEFIKLIPTTLFEDAIKFLIQLKIDRKHPGYYVRMADFNKPVTRPTLQNLIAEMVKLQRITIDNILRDKEDISKIIKGKSFIPPKPIADEIFDPFWS